MSVKIPLPFGPNINSQVLQGFGLELAPSETGTPTHQGTPEYYYAIDFPMVLETPILSQGNGEVIAMRENVSGWDESIGNFVTVRYDEGFVATYQHLNQDGVEVELHGRVIPHQLLGYSGNTGWSEGPHLHVTYGKQSIDRVDWGDGFVIANGSQAANHNTAPVLFATPEDTPEDIDGWGILNPGTSYRGDNIENTVGGSGNDVLIGRANNSELRGGSGHDLLLAAAGYDTLFGEDGNDALSGGPGDNILNGGDGNDMLSGNPNANDVMTGGPGNDQFIPSTGCNTITDFNYAEDSLWLSLPEGVKASGIFNQWANATLLTYPNGTVALENVNLGPPIPGAPEDSAEPLNVAQNYSSWLDWSDTLLIA